MDDEGPRTRPLRGQVVPEQAIGGALPFARGRHAEQPGLLVHDDDGGIVMDEAQGPREGDAAGRAEDDTVLRADHGPPVPAEAPVDLDAPGFEPLLEAPARGVGEERAQAIRQRRLAHSPLRTPSASSAAPATPAATVSGEPAQPISSAQRPTPHASAAARSEPQSPAATPRRAYSTAKARATKPRVAPS